MMTGYKQQKVKRLIKQIVDVNAFDLFQKKYCAQNLISDITPLTILLPNCHAARFALATKYQGQSQKCIWKTHSVQSGS